MIGGSEISTDKVKFDVLLGAVFQQHENGNKFKRVFAFNSSLYTMQRVSFIDINWEIQLLDLNLYIQSTYIRR